jgi:hypothetical protein
MKNRIISIIIVITVLMTTLRTVSLGNIQIPVEEVTIDDVFYVVGEDPSTGEAMISPTMTASWEDPESWYGSEDDDDYHEPEYYDITIKNVTSGDEDTFSAYEGSTIYNEKTFEVQEESTLDTGSIYKITVEPYHYHIDSDGTYELAQVSGTAEYAYGITDLDVDFDSNEDSIQVIWDDLGSLDIEYRIVYALGDYTSSSLDSLEDNKEGEITGLYFDSDDVEAYYDSDEKKNKLSYTITENIYPGQIYSIMVEPLVDYYNGEYVTRNRNYPYIRSTSTDVELELYEDGEYLRLEWDIPESFQVGQSQEEYDLVEATLVEYNDGVSSNIAIFDSNAAVLGYYKVSKPSESRDYQIFFVYDAVDDDSGSKASIEPESTVVTYDPSEILITPTSPVVPNLFSEDILDDLQDNYSEDEIRDILEEDYLVPGNTYDDDIDDILDENITFHIIDEDNKINFVFGAFQRIDVDESSDTYGEYIYDNNIYYSIWVTDELDALAYATSLYADKLYSSSGTPTNLIYEGDEICGYSQDIEQYYNDETGEIEDLVEDQIYYIKIVAKNITTNEELTSEPTITSIYYTYDGDAYQPPTISKPPLQIDEDETTETGVTVIWKENWWEIIEPNAASTAALYAWETEVWVDDEGNVYNEEVEDSEYFAIYEDESEITRFESYLSILGVEMDILQRNVDLGEDAYGVSDVRYLFAYLEYADVQSEITEMQESDDTYSFSDYYVDLIENDQDGSNPIDWEEIEPQAEDDDYISYRQEELLPNTSYLFMIYPYRELTSGELLYAQYPTPIVVATDPEATEVIADPTVPSLYVTDSTDMTISLSWKYNTEFDYTIMYSEYEDIDTAEIVDWEVEDESDENYPEDGEYYEMTVEDLFPDTDYYFWIQASQAADGTTSAWSNATSGKTDDVENPDAPRGLGIASDANMALYGYDESVTDEYITIEWILDEEDDYGDEDSSVDATTNVSKNYSYIIEVSDNENFIDPEYIESSNGVSDIIPENVTILDKNIVMISDLVANRSYYIRGITRVTVTGDGDDQLIVKDSLTYSKTIMISTQSTEDEYDGQIDPALEILPSSNYELAYDTESMTLAYRFYDGSDGENSVVQRVISEIIENNMYNYEIDVSSFQGYEISKRKITIPYDIMEVLNEYKVSVTILADDVELFMPYGAIEYELEDQVNRFGVAPEVVIEIETLDAFYITEQMPDSAITSVSIPQDIDISIVSDKKKTSLNYSDKEMTVNIKTNNRYELYNVDSVVYTRNYKEDWVATEAIFDSYTSNMTFKTAKIGAYGAYIVESNDYIKSDSSHWSNAYREAVFENYNVTGLDSYNPDGSPTESEIINIIYNYVTDNRNIEVDQYVSTAVSNTLYNAGIKTNTSKSKTSLTREEVISMFARAYEIKTDDIIQWDSTVYESISRNSTINAAYREELAKAATIGLISDVNNIRPKDTITYGELFVLWSKLEN